MSEGSEKAYVGRFAPSPTGPLHFGSLLAACASYLEARKRRGRWLLRIEDIDPPREQAGAADQIIAAIEAFGFEWDGPVLYQSASHDQHLAALAALKQQHRTYRCGCSRKDLADARVGPLGIIYPGTCRHGSDAEEFAVRFRVDDEIISFDDGLQGRQEQSMPDESGDFIVYRKDHLVAYHLAVVVDDHLNGITDIVRGIDLMDSTPRQIVLQKALGYDTPNYGHIPVAVHPDGDKLSKLTGAPGLDLQRAAETLVDALRALKLETPTDLATSDLSDIWFWALEHWDIKRLEHCTSVTIQQQQKR